MPPKSGHTRKRVAKVVALVLGLLGLFLGRDYVTVAAGPLMEIFDLYNGTTTK